MAEYVQKGDAITVTVTDAVNVGDLYSWKIKSARWKVSCFRIRIIWSCRESMPIC